MGSHPEPYRRNVTFWFTLACTSPEIVSEFSHVLIVIFKVPPKFVVTECIREPYMFLGQLFMLFQAVLLVCCIVGPVSDTNHHQPNENLTGYIDGIKDRVQP